MYMKKEILKALGLTFCFLPLISLIARTKTQDYLVTTNSKVPTVATSVVTAVKAINNVSSSIDFSTSKTVAELLQAITNPETFSSAMITTATTATTATPTKNTNIAPTIYAITNTTLTSATTDPANIFTITNFPNPPTATSTSNTLKLQQQKAWLILLSQGLPDAVLANAFRESITYQIPVVFRGFTTSDWGEGIKQLQQRIATIVKDYALSTVPNVNVDPRPFRILSQAKVPALIYYSQLEPLDSQLIPTKHIYPLYEQYGNLSWQFAQEQLKSNSIAINTKSRKNNSVDSENAIDSTDSKNSTGSIIATTATVTTSILTIPRDRWISLQQHALTLSRQTQTAVGNFLASQLSSSSVPSFPSTSAPSSSFSTLPRPPSSITSLPLSRTTSYQSNELNTTLYLPNTKSQVRVQGVTYPIRENDLITQAQQHLLAYLEKNPFLTTTNALVGTFKRIEKGKATLIHSYTQEQQTINVQLKGMISPQQVNRVQQTVSNLQQQIANSQLQPLTYLPLVLHSRSQIIDYKLQIQQTISQQKLFPHIYSLLRQQKAEQKAEQRTRQETEQESTTFFDPTHILAQSKKLNLPSSFPLELWFMDLSNPLLRQTLVQREPAALRSFFKQKRRVVILTGLDCKNYTDKTNHSGNSSLHQDKLNQKTADNFLTTSLSIELCYNFWQKYLGVDLMVVTPELLKQYTPTALTVVKAVTVDDLLRSKFFNLPRSSSQAFHASTTNRSSLHANIKQQEIKQQKLKQQELEQARKLFSLQNLRHQLIVEDLSLAAFDHELDAYLTGLHSKSLNESVQEKTRTLTASSNTIVNNSATVSHIAATVSNMATVNNIEDVSHPTGIIKNATTDSSIPVITNAAHKVTTNLSYQTIAEGGSLANATCPNASLLSSKLVTDICWDCMFPIRIAGTILPGTGKSQDVPSQAVKSPTCVCSRKADLPKVGYTMGFWQPVRLVELVRNPGCMMVLNGSKTRIGTANQLGTIGLGQLEGDGIAFMHYHLYSFPLLQILNLLNKDICYNQEFSSIDILYVSEIDPTWNYPEIAQLVFPETALFANEAAVLACGAQAIAQLVNSKWSYLPWCAGTWGTLYPMSGYSDDSGSGARITSLLATRALASSHRRGLEPRTIGKDALCRTSSAWEFLPEQYRMSMIYPMAQASKHPIGKSTFLWGEAANTSDAIYIVWRWRDCCSSTILPF